jgi:hypothetical protein
MTLRMERVGGHVALCAVACLILIFFFWMIQFP